MNVWLSREEVIYLAQSAQSAQRRFLIGGRRWMLGYARCLVVHAEERRRGDLFPQQPVWDDGGGGCHGNRHG